MQEMRGSVAVCSFPCACAGGMPVGESPDSSSPQPVCRFDSHGPVGGSAPEAPQPLVEGMLSGLVGWVTAGAAVTNHVFQSFQCVSGMEERIV